MSRYDTMNANRSQTRLVRSRHRTTNPRRRRMTFSQKIAYAARFAIAFMACALLAAVRFLLEPELIMNKIAAVALIVLTIPLIVLENDATVTVIFLFLFSGPMFFSDKSWF